MPSLQEKITSLSKEQQKEVELFIECLLQEQNNLSQAEMEILKARAKDLKSRIDKGVPDAEVFATLESKYAFANDDFKPMTLEQFESDIDKSLKDSESGRVVSVEELEQKIKTWGLSGES